MRISKMAAFGLLFCAGCTAAPPTRPARPDRSTWYHSPDGLLPEQVTPPSIPPQVREAFRAPSIPAKRNNGWLLWATAWNKPGGTEGFACVAFLLLEAIDAQGVAHRVSCQTYAQGDDVWGGWFPYTDQAWFTLGKLEGMPLDSMRVSLGTDNYIIGAFINTAEHAREPAAGHIWSKRWPRDLAPPGTVKFRMHVRFIAAGDALVNVGLDRYRVSDADAGPQQEVLVSDTYDASSGLVDVVAETVNIDWGD